MDTKGVIQRLREALPDTMAIYRFGSQVSGRTHQESDLDLAVLLPSPLPAVRRFEIEQDLAAFLHTNVDLVDLRAASTVFRMQVVSTGECLYARDETERRRFQTAVYSAYARLNEERREILTRITNEGHVYG
mgnify:CR=1 FL=1